MTKKRKANSPLQPSSPASAGVMEEVRTLREEVRDLRLQLQSLGLQHDSLQQSIRLVRLIFSGPSIPVVSAQEDVKEVIRSLLLRSMGFELDVRQVNTAFRVRNKIHVEFTSAAPGSNRDQLFRAKTKLRGSGLFITESLTPHRQELFQNLLHLKREKIVFAAFTQAGELFARKTCSSTPVKIRDHAALQQLCDPGHQQGRAQAGGGGSPPLGPSADLVLASSSADGVPGQVVDLSSPPVHHTVSPVPLVTSAGVPPRAATLSGHQGGTLVGAPTSRASSGAGLGAPVRPVGAARPPLPCSSVDMGQSGGGSGSGALSVGVRAPTSAPAAAEMGGSPPARRVTPTVRVSVRGRSRVINICNEKDVVETLGDLLRADAQAPSGRKDVDVFLCDFDRRASELCRAAETGQGGQQTAISARQVRAAADQWLQVSGYGHKS